MCIRDRYCPVPKQPVLVHLRSQIPISQQTEELRQLLLLYVSVCLFQMLYWLVPMLLQTGKTKHICSVLHMMTFYTKFCDKFTRFIYYHSHAYTIHNKCTIFNVLIFYLTCTKGHYLLIK